MSVSDVDRARARLLRKLAQIAEWEALDEDGQCDHDYVEACRLEAMYLRTRAGDFDNTWSKYLADVGK